MPYYFLFCACKAWCLRYISIQISMFKKKKQKQKKKKKKHAYVAFVQFMLRACDICNTKIFIS